MELNGEGQSRAGIALDLGPGFVGRVLLTTAVTGALASVFLALYLGWPKAAAWGVGVVLGGADLFLLDALIREAVGARRKAVLTALFVLKFAVLYGAGAGLLLGLHLSPFYVLAGFSLFLAVILLKVLGRLFLSTSWMSSDRSGAGGPWLRQGPGRGRPRP